MSIMSKSRMESPATCMNHVRQENSLIQFLTIMSQLSEYYQNSLQASQSLSYTVHILQGQHHIIISLFHLLLFQSVSMNTLVSGLKPQTFTPYLYIVSINRKHLQHNLLGPIGFFFIFLSSILYQVRFLHFYGGLGCERL